MSKQSWEVVKNIFKTQGLETLNLSELYLLPDPAPKATLFTNIRSGASLLDKAALANINSEHHSNYIYAGKHVALLSNGLLALEVIYTKREYRDQTSYLSLYDPKQCKALISCKVPGHIENLQLTPNGEYVVIRCEKTDGYGHRHRALKILDNKLNPVSCTASDIGEVAISNNTVAYNDRKSQCIHYMKFSGENAQKFSYKMNNEENRLSALAISPDNTFIAYISSIGYSNDAHINLISTKNNCLITKQAAPLGVGAKLKFSPNGSLLAMASGTDVKVFDIKTLSCVQAHYSNEKHSRLLDVFFTSDSNVLTSVSEENVCIWRLDSSRAPFSISCEKKDEYNRNQLFNLHSASLSSTDTLIVTGQHYNTSRYKIEKTASLFTIPLSVGQPIQQLDDTEYNLHYWLEHILSPEQLARPNKLKKLILKDIKLDNKAFNLLRRIITKHSTLVAYDLQKTGLSLTQRAQLIALFQKNTQCQSLKLNAIGLSALSTQILKSRLCRNSPKKPSIASSSSSSSLSPELEEENIPQVLLPESMDINFLCPITGKIMKEPMMLIEDFYTYESEALSEHLKHHNTSPKTGKALSKTDMVPNTRTKEEISMFLDEHPALKTSRWMYRSQALPEQLKLALHDNDRQLLNDVLAQKPSLLNKPVPQENSDEDKKPETVLTHILYQTTGELTDVALSHLGDLLWDKLIELSANDLEYWLIELLERQKQFAAEAITNCLGANTLDWQQLFWSALEAGKENLLELLIDLGADPTATNPEGKTAIDVFIQLSRPANQLLNFISQYNLSIEQCNDYGDNALHTAAKLGRTTYINTLMLELGLSAKQTNLENLKPAEIARKHHHQACADTIDTCEQQQAMLPLLETMIQPLLRPLKNEIASLREENQALRQAVQQMQKALDLPEKDVIRLSEFKQRAFGIETEKKRGEHSVNSKSIEKQSNNNNL